MTAGAGPVEELTGIPAALLWYAGLGLFPFAAFVAYLATRETVSRMGVWAVIVCNALWAADSLLLLASGWVEPTGLGIVFVVAQAAAVAAFAEAEYFGMRRAPVSFLTTETGSSDGRRRT